MSKYSDMFERVRGKPCVLGDLLIDGLQRTDRRVVERELEGLKSAATLDEIKDVLIGATNRLHEMDIFDTVEMRVGAGTEGDDEGTPDTADVMINLHESNILKIHGGSYVNQSGEGSLEATVGVKNSLGWAERFDASFEVGNQKSSTFSLSAAQPRVWGTRGELQAQIFQATTNNQRFCSFTETMRGAQISLHSDDGRHRVRLEGGWQEISDQSRMHSKLMQGQMGHRLRSSVTYTWTHHQVLAEEGVESGLAPLLGLKSETQIGVAPIGGAVGFAKQVLSGMVKLPTGNGSDLTFAAKAGVLLPLGDKTGARPSCISDRFFIGGPSSLRGFCTRGVGPMDVRRPPSAKGVRATAASEDGLLGAQKPLRDDALGGDLMCMLLAEFNFRLPHKVLDAFDARGHVFLNAGNTALLGEQRGGLQEKLGDFAGNLRVAAGVGVFLPTAVGRFEVNYCRVLSSRPGDRVKHGMQFGVVTDIL